MKKHILILAIIFSAFITFAQDDDNVIEITAKVIDSGTLEHISYVKVVNLKKRRAIKSDSLGNFNITILKDDMLKVSAIGYYTKYISFNDSITNDLSVKIITLEEKTYAFAKIDILKGRWNDLKFEIAHTEIKKDENTENIERWLLSLISTKELAMITAAASVGIPITYTTSKQKQRNKVNELMILDKEEKIIYSKYNRAVVEKITNYTGKKLSKFMHFCNFKRNFLLHANDYDIVNEIKKRQTAYQKRKKTSFN